MYRTLALIVLLLGILGSKAPAAKEEWQSLFEGKSLGAWKMTEFALGGEARVEAKFRGKGPAIVVEMGDSLSGVTWSPDEQAQKVPIPKTNYEIALEFLKIEGNDFACGLTFPVAESHATLILGGWGGTTVGISSIDDRDASRNETTKSIAFPKDRWFRVRLRVTPDRIESWLDGKKIVDQDIRGRKISLRGGEILRSVPLGIATYRTTAAFRNIRLKRLDEVKPAAPGS